MVDATNLGPDLSTGLNITNQLSSGLEIVRSTADAGTSFDTATGVWNVGSLAVGSVNRKRLTLVVKPTAAGYFSQTAFKTFANEYDKNGGNTSDGNNSTVASGEAIAPPVALPVSLVKFTAHEQINGVLLNLTTASEKNSDYFAVERSQDGKVFKQIGLIKSQGTSSQLHHYQFLDTKTPVGWTYYRLHQVDLDRKADYSNILAIYQSGKQVNGVQVKVFPNPAADVVNLDVAFLPDTDFTVSIFDLQGKKIQQHTIGGGTISTLPISNLPTGKYIIHVSNSTFMQVLQLIKK